MRAKIAAMTLGLLANPALAEVHGSVSYGFFETELEFANVSLDFDTPTLQLALGNSFNNYLSAEFRLGLAADKDSSFGLDLEISDYYALYVKPTLPVSDTLSAYLLLGVARTNLDSSVGDDDDDDVSYGVGFSANAGQGFDVFAEYVNLYDDSDSGVSVEIAGFNIGLAYTFP